jgi:lysophospholipase L1-like esterase
MALKGGERTEPVRVLWLGDSHTAADFWPDAVRRPLAARYGSGGPGFLFLGLKDYRHSGVKVWRQGAWQVRPPQPATSKPTDDGVFGLGGVRAVADGEDASLHVRLKAGAVEGDANWDLAFRLPNADSGFRIRGEAMRPILATGATHPTGSIQHITWRTVATARIDIDGVQGVVEFFGVVVEGSRPGIVIDTLGINGARAATPLAWDATQWTEQVRRRDPNLVVMAYGTNETGDGAPPERYAPQYEELVARIRRAAPDADCLIAGPTDREGRGVITGRVKLITAVQEQAAEKLGCAFFSTQDAMGGEGGFTYWSEVRGSFTSADGVHLAPRGYAELGAQIVRVLLSPRPGLLALP